jgi:hypothetical protein
VTLCGLDRLVFFLTEVFIDCSTHEARIKQTKRLISSSKFIFNLYFSSFHSHSSAASLSQVDKIVHLRGRVKIFLLTSLVASTTTQASGLNVRPLGTVLIYVDMYSS